MARTFLIIIGFLASFWFSVPAWADAAASAYQGGQYQEAIQEWEALARTTPRGEVFFNLGNSYFKNNQPGQAVAAYLAARSLKPRDPDVTANLNFIRGKAGDKLENDYERSLWQRFFSFDDTLNLKEQFWAATILITLGLLAIGTRWWLHRGREVSTLAGVVLLVAGLWLGFGTTLRLTDPIILGAITAPSGEIRAEKGGSDAPVLFQLSAGTPVRIVAADDAWVRIALPDGKGGWLPRSEVAYFTL